MSFEFVKMESSENYHSPKDTEVDVNLNGDNPELKNSDISDRTELKDKKKPGKIFRSAFGLLLILGVLLTLCVVGILYHNKVISYEILSEQYSNVSETLMMQEHKVKEIEKLFKVLQVEHQQVQEDLATCSANKNQGQCEEGWKSLGLKSYYFSSSKLNWEQSRDYCVEKGGHMVIITSQTEQDFVVSQIGETHWIGLHDLETEGQWMWVNNQPLKETGVTFWFSAREGPNEPDNWTEDDPSGENCAALGDAYGNIHTWFDASCSTMKKCICEK